MFKNLSAGALGIRTNLAGALALARDHGFAGVDINIADAARLAQQYGIESVRRLFEDAGVRIGSFGLPLDFRKDEATWHAGMEVLPALADLARAVGADRCATWLLPFSDDLTFAENVRLHVERLRPAAEILEQRGIRLGLEFVGVPSLRAGRRYSFVHSLDGMLALCAAIGVGNVGLLLDSYHWYTSHGTLADLAHLSNRDVVVVHVNDAPAGVPIEQQQDTVRALPCETGVIPLAGFMRALADMAYDGPVTVEPFSRRLQAMTPDEAAAATAAALDRLWATAGLAQ